MKIQAIVIKDELIFCMHAKRLAHPDPIDLACYIEMKLCRLTENKNREEHSDEFRLNSDIHIRLLKIDRNKEIELKRRSKRHRKPITEI